jgi:hypothetical protein
LTDILLLHCQKYGGISPEYDNIPGGQEDELKYIPPLQMRQVTINWLDEVKCPVSKSHPANLMDYITKLRFVK